MRAKRKDVARVQVDKKLQSAHPGTLSFAYSQSMESMRSTWTDSRLDDLNGRVSDLSGRIASLQRTIIQVGGALIAAFIGLMAAVLGLAATQL
jgi:TolA-binding protein